MSPPQRLLFIGNSYTQRNDLPGLLESLVRAAGGNVTTGRVIANGASLRHHWNAGRAEEVIRTGAWDGVVLQEQSTLPVKNATRYHENVRLFAPVVREQGAGLALYLPWVRQAAPASQSILNEAVSAIAAETGGLVIPVGPAWERVLRRGTGPELYDRDGSHPTLAGSYVAACVFYGALWGRSPEGLPGPPGVAPELQRDAWETVRGFGPE